ncbi:MAG: 4-hydroxy-tetrahydrodipicolinate reductase [Deltaproteobacteria bacterium]|nr:4-hydroxy-tetrahydrodipicolinate reductase [Deltaproteobacteria bacterium]
MEKITKIFLCGAGGRMGLRLLELIQSTPTLAITGALEREDSPWLGKEAVPDLNGKGSIPFECDYGRLKESDVLVDFSTPEGVAKNVLKAEEYLKPVVIGVTALGVEITQIIRFSSLTIPIICAPNLSFGVNLMYVIVQEMARILGGDYDLEVVESHHNRKKDAPSGTALKLYEVLCAARELDLKTAMRHGREGVVGPRTTQEIGIHAIRGGDTVGEHTVIFAGPGETLEITHRALSRDAFANGALKAAQWIVGKDPGLYSFSEVLGL